MLVTSLTPQIGAGRLIHATLCKHTGIKDKKNVKLNPFLPVPVNKHNGRVIVIAIGDAENRNTIDDPDDQFTRYIDDGAWSSTQEANCSGPDCIRKPIIYWAQEWTIEHWAVKAESCDNPVERVLEDANTSMQLLVSNQRLVEQYLELLSQDKPQIFTEGEIEAAVLSQTWQTRHRFQN